MNILRLHWLALAFVIWTLTIVLPAASYLVADTMTVGASGRLTMNPPVSTTVAGDLATKWRRFAAVTIVQPVEVTHLRELTDQRLLPTRCRLFRRIRVLVARILVARDHDHVEVQSRIPGTTK